MYIIARSYIQWNNDDDVHFILDQHTLLDLYNARSLKQQSTGKHANPLGHIILIPSQSVFDLNPLSSKYQF
jgi:hypothetical protein